MVVGLWVQRGFGEHDRVLHSDLLHVIMVGLVVQQGIGKHDRALVQYLLKVIRVGLRVQQGVDGMTWYCFQIFPMSSWLVLWV